MSGTETIAPVVRADLAPVRQGYSDEEYVALYALAREFLATGDLPSAERIARGLVALQPRFSSAWMIQAYIALMREDLSQAIHFAREALKHDSTMCEALLCLVIAYFNLEDYQSGGTYLGEVSDLIDGRKVSPELRNVYQSQMARFQLRLGRKAV
ncbi:MAG: tetratricopeptide repeat protein [Bdellovibrionales bacterium]|nr:tetratricopeptide repeat protein [Bdellovibrionales bacterium]